MKNFKSIQIPLLPNNNIEKNYIYKEFSPSKTLSPYICCYWILKSKENIKENHSIVLLPDGCINLVFALGEEDYEKNAFLFGLIKKSYNIELNDYVNYFGIRLLPGNNFMFFDRPANFFLNKIDFLNKFMEDFKSYIPCKTINIDNIENNIDMIEFYIEKYMLNKNNIDNDPIVDMTLKYLYENKGQVTINELTEISSITSKTLFRKYNNWVGISPKLFSRIVRFQNVLSTISKSEKIDWLDIALKNGYYDQAHFIKEFKEFYGQSPSSLICQ